MTKEEIALLEKKILNETMYKPISANDVDKTIPLKNVSNSDNISSAGPTIGIRHLQTVLLFLLLGIGYAMRVNLSVAIVAMNTPNTSSNPDIPVYHWDDQSIVLSSFYWGYIILQIFAGYIGGKFGPKWFLVGTMTINSLMCIATPFASDKFGSKGAMICRVIQGLSQGFFFPSSHNILSKWVPPSERSKLGTVAYSGPPCGIIVAMPIVGLISASWYGWPASFYVFGAMGIAWVVLWAILGANSPAEHKYISDAERSYIQNSLGHNEEQSIPPTPWKKIFTSLPVWSIFISGLGMNWGNTILLTELPTYLSGYIGFKIKDNALLSSAPFLATVILGFFFGPVSDYIINKKYMSRVNARKLFNTIGLCSPAIALTILSFVPKDQSTLCVALLIIGVGMTSATTCAFQINHIDLAPAFAGILMGICNGAANSFSVVGPLVVHYVIGEDTSNPVLWREIFLLSSGFYIAVSVFYIIFAKAEVQAWNGSSDVKEKTASYKDTIITSSQIKINIKT